MTSNISTPSSSDTADATLLDPLAQANRNMRLYQINEQKCLIDEMSHTYDHGQAKLMILRVKLGRMGFNLLNNDFSPPGCRVRPGPMRMFKVMLRLKWELRRYEEDIQERLVRWKDARLAFEEEDLAAAMNPLAKRMKLLAVCDHAIDEEEEEVDG